MLHLLDEPAVDFVASVVRSMAPPDVRLRLMSARDARTLAAALGATAVRREGAVVALDLSAADPFTVASVIAEFFDSDGSSYKSVELLHGDELAFCLDLEECVCLVDDGLLARSAPGSAVRQLEGRTVTVDAFDDLDESRDFLDDVAASIDRAEIDDVLARALAPLPSDAPAEEHAARHCNAAAVVDRGGEVVGALVLRRFGRWRAEIADDDVLRHAARSVLESELAPRVAGLDEAIAQRVTEIARRCRSLA